jgi:hypothetical protein
VDSVGVPRVPTYSGTFRERMPFPRTGLSPSVVRLSSSVPLTDSFVTPMWKALQPRRGKPPRFRLFPFRSPLLGKSRFLSFPADTEMFQFSAFATYAYGFSVCQFGYPGIGARLTATPGLSQSSTPFIASWRQDIPHAPLIAWPHESNPPSWRQALKRRPAAATWLTHGCYQDRNARLPLRATGFRSM